MIRYPPLIQAGSEPQAMVLTTLVAELERLEVPEI